MSNRSNTKFLGPDQRVEAWDQLGSEQFDVVVVGGGVVVLATDRQLGQVAIKLTRTGGEESKFRREAQVLKRVAHENVSHLLSP